MKIGYILDDSLDSSDGVQQYILLLGEWMRNKGHEVHYFVGSTRRSDIPNIHSMSKNVHVKFNKNRLTVPYKLNRSKLKDVNDSFDVLHVQVPYSPLLAGKIIKRASNKTAIVGTFHIAPYDKLVSFSNTLLRLITRGSLKRFDEIVAVSEVAKSFAKDTFEIETKVIPNSIEISKWRNSKNKNIDILFLGRLVERKGCKLLLKSLVRMSKDQDITELNVVVAGDGSLRQELEDYSKKHNLAETVKFVGYVSEDKKKDLLSRSIVSIFPSIGGESFGIVLLEAMASGSIAIGGNNPGYNYVIGGVENSIFETNVADISDRLSKILGDKLLQKQMLNKQKKLLQKYDINTVGNDIMLMYKSALKKRKL